MLSSYSKYTYVVAVSLTATCFNAHGQDGINIGEPLTKGDLTGKLSFDVPSSAGFAILGVSPENVLTPRKGSELALGLLNGLDQQGNLQNGIAIEANPYFWALPEQIQLDAYLGSKKYRILSGFSFSLASTSGQDDADKAERVGFGINYTYDFDDPLYSQSLSECVFPVLTSVGDEYLTERGNITIEEKTLSNSNSNEEAGKKTIELARSGILSKLQAKGEKLINNCFTSNVKWNRTSIQVGLGVHNSNVEAEDPIDESGNSAWFSYSTGVGNYYQIIAHVNYSNDLLIASGDTLQLTDRIFGGGKVKFGSDSYKGFLEAGYTNSEIGDDSDDYWQAALGAEIKLRDGIFIQLVYGDTFGSINAKREYFSSQLKWAITPSSVFPKN